MEDYMKVKEKPEWMDRNTEIYPNLPLMGSKVHWTFTALGASVALMVNLSLRRPAFSSPLMWAASIGTGYATGVAFKTLLKSRLEEIEFEVDKFHMEHEEFFPEKVRRKIGEIYEPWLPMVLDRDPYDLAAREWWDWKYKDYNQKRELLYSGQRQL